MMRVKQNSGVGFTLIELLIVVAIIGILAAIAIPNFLQAQVRAKVARTQSDLNSYALALETYRVDNNAYIPSCGAGSSNEAARYCENYWSRYCNSSPILLTERFNRLTTPVEYLASLPTDPFGPTLIDPKIYLYYDDCEVDIWMPRFPVTKGWSGIPSVGQWMNIGAGPDNAYEVTVLWGADGYFTSYDPTNGTISRGDIFRFGP